MRMHNVVAVAVVLLLAGGVDAQERPRLPQGPAGTVTLPVVDYDRLIDRAAQPEKLVDGPPVAAVVTRSDLRARADGEHARGTLRVDGEVFGRGHVKVPLVSGATLLDARAEGRPLPLLQQGDAHAAVLTGPSAFSLTLDWVVPLTLAPGRASFVLPVPAGGTVGAAIDLPGDPADVRVEPGLTTRRQTADGRTTLDVTLEPGKRTQISWSVRDTTPEAVVVETRMLADVKSLATIGDGDLRLVSLIDITVVRGQPRTIDVRIPSGFEVASVSGASLETSATRDGVVTFTVRDPSRRRHQFLISLEQSRAAGSFKAETAFPAVAGVEREAGEAAVEATGTVEVIASGDALRRMDVRETHASLRSLARQPLLAAFRYQRRPNESRVMTLDVTRFADAPVVAAAAERAVATTLVTVEGRMLTEVQLTLRNRAQPFMKVTLPSGATMLSVEVAGETAKPVMGSDGTRVPLLRAGFRPDGPYTVSFVYLHAGPAFARSGEAHMLLPSMDVPVSVLEWELFLPERISAKPSGGNVMPAPVVLDASSALATYTETVAVEAATPAVDARAAPRMEETVQQAPSQNVMNLQRRVAGVLPVRIDVPRTGTSYRFVRPLVLEEETNVTFKYKRR